MGRCACAGLECRRRLALHAQGMVAQVRGPYASVYMMRFSVVSPSLTLCRTPPGAQEEKALEDKLGNLKDQLTDLRSAIKSFETEFDQRLDACLQQVSRLTCLFALLSLPSLLSFWTTKDAYSKRQTQLCRCSVRFVPMHGCRPLSASCADVQSALARGRVHWWCAY